MGLTYYDDNHVDKDGNQVSKKIVKPKKKIYDDRTVQAHKDECDVNKIMKKAQRVDTLSHLGKFGEEYVEFAQIDSLLDAHEQVLRGQAIFEELPSELRAEFGDMGTFFDYVNDPANVDDLRAKLPALAEPGRQLPAVRRSAASQADPKLTTSQDPPQAVTDGSDAGDASSPT